MMGWLKAAGAAMKLVPNYVWYALFGALALHFALGWHSGKVKAHDAATIAARDAYWNDRIQAVAKQAAGIRDKAENTARQITEKVRTDNENQARIIAADAGALRLRGPGAASDDCRSVDHSGIPVAAGGAGQGGGAGAAARPQVPDGDRASVSWRWLVNSAEQADLNRAEVLSWRSWYQQQAAAWEKMRTSDGVQPNR